MLELLQRRARGQAYEFAEASDDRDGFGGQYYSCLLQARDCRRLQSGHVFADCFHAQHRGESWCTIASVEEVGDGEGVDDGGARDFVPDDAGPELARSHWCRGGGICVQFMSPAISPRAVFEAVAWLDALVEGLDVVHTASRESLDVHQSNLAVLSSPASLMQCEPHDPQQAVRRRAEWRSDFVAV